MRASSSSSEIASATISRSERSLKFLAMSYRLAKRCGSNLNPDGLMFLRAYADHILLSQHTGDNKNMKNKLILSIVLSGFAFIGVANAFPTGEVGSGTL